MELSFEAKRGIVQAALKKMFPVADGDAMDSVWVRDLYIDRVIFAQDGKLFQAPYTINGQEAALGEAQPVVEDYVSTNIASYLVDLAVNAPADKKRKILPAGQFKGRDGRAFNLGDARTVIAETRALGMDLPVDYDHQTDYAAIPGVGGRAPAAGWIDPQSLEARKDGIWGEIQWNASGQKAVNEKEYRYLSPVFQHSKSSGEVTRLLRAALTNNPNLYMGALASRQQDSQRLNQGDKMDELLKKLAAMFGLPADSTQEKVLASAQALVATCTAQSKAIATMAAAVGCGAGDAIDEIVTSVQSAITNPDASKFVPAGIVTSLQSQVRELQQLEHMRVVDEAIAGNAAGEVKLPPAQREWAIAQCAANFEGFKKFLANQPAIALGKAPLGKGGTGGSGVLDEEDLAVCSAMGVSPEEFKKTREKEGSK